MLIEGLWKSTNCSSNEVCVFWNQKNKMCVCVCERERDRKLGKTRKWQKEWD